MPLFLDFFGLPVREAMEFRPRLEWVRLVARSSSASLCRHHSLPWVFRLNAYRHSGCVAKSHLLLTKKRVEEKCRHYIEGGTNPWRNERTKSLNCGESIISPWSVRIWRGRLISTRTH